MTAAELYDRARSFGLHLEADGGSLLVWPKSKVPPDFADVLREHKPELLAWLAAPANPVALGKYPPHEFDDVLAGFPRGAHHPTPTQARLDGWDRLAADRAAWLHIAQQVLAGEFAGADRSTRESLAIGLRAMEHPICNDALARIKALRK